VRGYAEAVSRKGNIRRRGSKVRRLRLAGLAANFRANCGVFQRPKSHQEFASKAKRNREERHWRESPRFSEPPSAIIQNRERSRVCEEAALSLSLSALTKSQSTQSSRPRPLRRFARWRFGVCRFFSLFPPSETRSSGFNHVSQPRRCPWLRRGRRDDVTIHYHAICNYASPDSRNFDERPLSESAVTIAEPN